jgi:hypothetical protein
MLIQIVFKILFRGFYSPESDPSHNIRRDVTGHVFMTRFDHGSTERSMIERCERFLYFKSPRPWQCIVRRHASAERQSDTEEQ